MGIFQYLTDEDKEMIDQYREYYATAKSEDSDYIRTRTSSDKAPLEHVLRIWSKSKERLYHLFGDKFICEYEVNIDKPEREMANQMRNIFTYGQNIFDIRNENTITKAHEFFTELREKVYGDDYDTRSALSCMFNYTDLVRNSFPYNGYSFNGMKIQKGMKLIRLIEKAAQHYGVEGFEEFRLAHSLVLNNKKSKGTICLSIHPLDYMTMSDNYCEWSSCMSWIQDGCYRQGTVEMMNSEYVVVGYLKANDDVTYARNVKWNNKKWRQLFVVAPEILTGVKQYPCLNEEASRFCLDALKAMFANGTYSDNCVEMEDENEVQNYICSFNGKEVDYDCITFSFNTNYMYSDFGSVSNIPCYLGNCLENGEYYNIQYSGESECMWCGNTRWLDSDTLLCSDCYIEEEDDEYEYCDNCGDRVYYGDAYTLDDETYCEYCYNEYAVETIDDTWDSHHRSNCMRFAVVKEDGIYNVTNEYGSCAYYYVYTSLSNFNTFMKQFEEFGLTYPMNTSSFYRGVLADNTIFLRDNQATRDFLENYDLQVDEEYSRVVEVRWHKTNKYI